MKKAILILAVFGTAFCYGQSVNNVTQTGVSNVANAAQTGLNKFSRRTRR